MARLRKILIRLFLFYILLSFVIGLFRITNTSKYNSHYEEEICDQYRELINDTAYIQRGWTSNTMESYCTNYLLNKKQVDSSIVFKNSVSISDDLSDDEFWGTLYNELSKNDAPKLKRLEDSLLSIKNERQLSEYDFADLIVSFVQDIPYCYVMQDKSCENREQKQLPCVEGQKYGINTPTEFLYSLNGDCDTRTVLLYTILKTFGYGVKIMISDAYMHSVLAINLKTTGDYFLYRGEKFYFWETTATGWPVGILPAEMNNIKNWTIALN